MCRRGPVEREGERAPGGELEACECLGCTATVEFPQGHRGRSKGAAPGLGILRLADRGESNGDQ